MKVLIIDVNYKNSSTGFIVEKTKEYLEKKGDEAVVCYGRGEAVKDTQVYKFGLDFETIFHAFMTRITGFTGCFSALSTIKLKKIIKQTHPDIIHIHELHGYFVNITSVLKFIQKSNIPVVWTFHCEFMYTGKCGHALECKKYLDKCGGCPHLKEYPSSLFFDRTKTMLKQKKKIMLGFKKLFIVTPSKWLAQRVSDTYLKKFPISVVHNGVDTSVFNYCGSDYSIFDNLIEKDRKIILFVASNAMSENKGGKYTYKIASSLSSDYAVVIVGANVDKPILYNGVYLFPHLNDKKILAKMYSTAFVSLLLSKRETYGLTIAESLCCGTKVVAFESGAPETVFLDHNVVFVKYGDLDCLVSKIQSIATYDKDDVSKESIGKYSSSTMCSNYFDIYSKLLLLEEEN